MYTNVGGGNRTKNTILCEKPARKSLLTRPFEVWHLFWVDCACVLTRQVKSGGRLRGGLFPQGPEVDRSAGRASGVTPALKRLAAGVRTPCRPDQSNPAHTFLPQAFRPRRGGGLVPQSERGAGAP